MSKQDEVWILGINMTKFGKYPDRDIVDLGAEAIQAALKDAGVTMGDIVVAERKHGFATPVATPAFVPVT